MEKNYRCFHFHSLLLVSPVLSFTEGSFWCPHESSQPSFTQFCDWKHSSFELVICASSITDMNLSSIVWPLLHRANEGSQWDFFSEIHLHYLTISNTFWAPSDPDWVVLWYSVMCHVVDHCWLWLQHEWTQPQLWLAQAQVLSLQLHN